jgi:hypothetical protein
MPPSSESYTFAKKSLGLESQIARRLTACLYLFVFPLSFATRTDLLSDLDFFHLPYYSLSLGATLSCAAFQVCSLAA